MDASRVHDQRRDVRDALPKMWDRRWHSGVAVRPARASRGGPNAAMLMCYLLGPKIQGLRSRLCGWTALRAAPPVPRGLIVVIRRRIRSCCARGLCLQATRERADGLVFRGIARPATPAGACPSTPARSGRVPAKTVSASDPDLASRPPDSRTSAAPLASMRLNRRHLIPDLPAELPWGYRFFWEDCPQYRSNNLRVNTKDEPAQLALIRQSRN